MILSTDLRLVCGLAGLCLSPPETTALIQVLIVILCEECFLLLATLWPYIGWNETLCNGNNAYSLQYNAYLVQHGEPLTLQHTHTFLWLGVCTRYTHILTHSTLCPHPKKTLSIIYSLRRQPASFSSANLSCSLKCLHLFFLWMC